MCSVFVSAEWGGSGYADGVTMGAQFQTQLLGTVYTIVWTAVVTYIVLKVVNLFIPLRVEEHSEIRGLDVTQHEERGYNL